MKELTYSRILLTLFVMLLSRIQLLAQDATMLVANAKIWTSNSESPWAEAMAIHHDKILKIGSEDEISKYRNDDKVVYVDAEGRMIVPGLIDTHVHLMQAGSNLNSVQLRDARSPEEFIERVKEFAKTQPKGTWITGGDWDHQNWGGELPNRSWIDSVSADHPIMLNRLDGHMILANSLAMKIARLSKSVGDIDGGEIGRNVDGELSGIFKDNAMALVRNSDPQKSLAQLISDLTAATKYLHKYGVTSIHDITNWDHISTYKKAYDSVGLKLRIYSILPLQSWNYVVSKVNKEEGDKWWSFGGLKGFVDGSLGSHTAAFFDSYLDTPGEKGLFMMNPDSIYSWVKKADAAGLQSAIHAIGDKAIHTQLDIYEKVMQENGPKDRRFRIEHAQHISPDDIGRFAELDVIASMQPYHAIDDGRWAEQLIGRERAKTTYAFNSLFETGARVAFGSDWFVAPPQPMYGIYAAVTRKTLDGKNPEGWIPSQKISIEQALKAYTINAAYAGFQEGVLGSLVEGKLADFVILEENLFNISPNDIKDVEVWKTFVGGIEVYSKN